MAIPGEIYLFLEKDRDRLDSTITKNAEVAAFCLVRTGRASGQ
jgi:hypothetical protein